MSSASCSACGADDPFECDCIYPRWTITGPGKFQPQNRYERGIVRVMDLVEMVIDELVRIPPFSWADWFLGGFVGRSK